MELSPFQAVVRPVVSEKSTALGAQSKYVFEVAPSANKIQIKNAIETAFAGKKIEVTDVNILRQPGKLRRLGKHQGMTRSWKKAIVTLKRGQQLDLFEGV
jgi:large subunit ribosomal protein L23